MADTARDYSVPSHLLLCPIRAVGDNGTSSLIYPEICDWEVFMIKRMALIGINGGWDGLVGSPLSSVELETQPGPLHLRSGLCWAQLQGLLFCQMLRKRVSTQIYHGLWRCIYKTMDTTESQTTLLYICVCVVRWLKAILCVCVCSLFGWPIGRVSTLWNLWMLFIKWKRKINFLYVMSAF